MTIKFEMVIGDKTVDLLDFPQLQVYDTQTVANSSINNTVRSSINASYSSIANTNIAPSGACFATKYLARMSFTTSITPPAGLNTFQVADEVTETATGNSIFAVGAPDRWTGFTTGNLSSVFGTSESSIVTYYESGVTDDIDIIYLNSIDAAPLYFPEFIGQGVEVTVMEDRDLVGNPTGLLTPSFTNIFPVAKIIDVIDIPNTFFSTATTFTHAAATNNVYYIIENLGTVSYGNLQGDNYKEWCAAAPMIKSINGTSFQLQHRNIKPYCPAADEITSHDTISRFGAPGTDTVLNSSSGVTKNVKFEVRVKRLIGDTTFGTDYPEEVGFATKIYVLDVGDFNSSLYSTDTSINGGTLQTNTF